LIFSDNCGKVYSIAQPKGASPDYGFAPFLRLGCGSFPPKDSYQKTGGSI
jgi:hypothetical protein